MDRCDHNIYDKLLQSCTEFTNKRINEFQILAGSFFKAWVELNGMARVTNYIHMLGSSHIMEFLYIFRKVFTARLGAPE